MSEKTLPGKYCYRCAAHNPTDNCCIIEAQHKLKRPKTPEGECDVDAVNTPSKLAEWLRKIKLGGK